MFEVNLLGGFRIMRAGLPVEIPSRPAQALLAYLLLNPGRPVRREKLAGLLWPEADEANARSNLRHALWRIRKALEAPGELEYFEATDLGVSLQLQSGDWLDVAELESSQRLVLPVKDLLQLAERCSGELLPGFYDDWVGLERTRLHAVYENCLQSLVVELLRLERWNEAATWSEKWISIGGAPEPAYRFLMLASAAQGNQAGVGAAYLRCSETLRQELGLEPATQTRELYQDLVGGEPASSALAQTLKRLESKTPALPLPAGSFPGAGASPQPDRVAPNNLPVQLTTTIERAHELSAVTKLFTEGQAHLVTLVGPPGIGKTRLSVLVGNCLLGDYPDGVWFVDLTEISNPDFFLSSLVRSLVTLDLPPIAHLSQLVAGLRDRRLLLILDNFEHLVEKAAVETAQLLRGCPHLRILATSRVPLRIYGEHEYPLPPLSVPPPEAATNLEELENYEAVQLFVARARQHQSWFSITRQNAAAIVDICTILEGLPLALELAAASLRRMSVDEMSAALCRMEGENWIRLFSLPARDLPARQQTLENVVAWSYRLLTEPQQALFCRLAVFNGWFDAEAVAEICFEAPRLSPQEARIQLEGLQEQSLLARREVNGVPCWRMLEVIHEYADLQFGKQGRTALEPLHFEHYLKRLRAFGVDGNPHTMAGFFELHAANFHGALQWTIHAQAGNAGLQMAMLLYSFWMTLGNIREGLSFFHGLLDLPVAFDPALHAEALGITAELAWQRHDFETSLDFTRQAAEIGRVHHLTDATVYNLNRLGRVYIEKGEFDLARQALTETLAIARAAPEILESGVPLAQLGELALFEGQLDEAQLLLEQALSLLAPDKVIFLAMARADLAEIALAQGDAARAMHWLTQAYDPASQHIRRTLVFLCALGGYILLSGSKAERTTAIQFYGAIEALAERSGVIFSPFYLSLIEQRMTQLRQGLSPTDWQAEFETGRKWTRETALSEAKCICTSHHQENPG